MIKPLLVLFLCAAKLAVADPIVCYSAGCVRGRSFVGNVKPFEGFFGIPFAKQPIGELRFKDPQPLTEKFRTIYNATEEKPFCMQKNYLLPSPVVMGVEDCLYLYVYRPKNWMRKNRKPLPVIVYIHGGAFFAGTAGPSLTGGDYIMDTEDVIFVTVSYRLGPLGFLSTGDETMSGNYGLKDQAMAIKWVKDNIGAFGGDCSSITLMGQSAGASSVHLHMMSPLSSPHFHKAVIISGNGNAPYAYVIRDPLKQTREYAAAAGINGAAEMSAQQLASSLKTVDPVKLLDASDSFKVWSVDPLTLSRPVVEDCRKVDGFLCDDPVRLWRRGQYARMPVLTGYMDGDGGVRAITFFNNQTQLDELNDRFAELIPKLLEIEDPTSEKVTLGRLEKVKNRYFGGQGRLVESMLDNLVRLYTERSFLAPMANTLLQMVKSEHKGTAYLYKFNFKGRYSYSPLYTGTLKDYGVVHCDELIYLLKSPLLFTQEFETGSSEALFRAKFVKFFTYFAVSGKPPKVSNKTLQKCAKNEAISTGSRQLKCSYVDFDEKIAIKFDGGIDNDAVDFWNEIDNTMVA